MATVLIEDCRALGLCKPGVKKFLTRYAIDLRRFVKEGLPEEELLALDNALAIKVVEHARQREEAHGAVRR